MGEDEEMESVTFWGGSNGATRDGYACIGWSTKPDGKVVYYDRGGEQGWTLTKSTTLYAVWEKTVTITLDANGGKFIGMLNRDDIKTSSDRKK